MLKPSLHAIAASCALALVTTLAGCKDSDLRRLEAPSAGVHLTYDLSPGQSYMGHVRRGESVQSKQFTFNRSLEYDVHLTSLGEDPQRGDTLVKATFTHVKVEWNLGPDAPPGINLGEFVQDAEAKIQGMEVRFNVGDRGDITHMPPPPQEGVSDQLKLVIDNVLDSVERAFLVVPDKTVAIGETWDEREKKGREGKLGRYREGTVTTTLEGYYRHEDRQEDVARLLIRHDGRQTITTKAGSHSSEWSGKFTALFSVSGKYLAAVEGERREFDPTQGTTFSKVNVQWTKQARTGSLSGGEVQSIDDPCDPDYVGPAECVRTQSITDPCDPDYVGPDACETQSITDPCDPDYVGPEACESSTPPTEPQAPPEGPAPPKGAAPDATPPSP